MSSISLYKEHKQPSLEFEQAMADALTEQNIKINRLTIEVVKFGMMLLAVEEYISYNQVSFGSLKHWLHKWCPSINYKTANRHKQLAVAVREKCDLQASGALVYEAIEEKDSELYQKVSDCVTGSSARQLLLDFKVKEAPEHPVGRPEGSIKPVPPAITRDKVREMALEELVGITDAVEQFFRFDKDLLIDNPIAKQMAVQAFRHAIDRLTVR